MSCPMKELRMPENASVFNVLSPLALATPLDMSD
jgi:hypothetical protein